MGRLRGNGAVGSPRRSTQSRQAASGNPASASHEAAAAAELVFSCSKTSSPSHSWSPRPQSHASKAKRRCSSTFRQQVERSILVPTTESLAARSFFPASARRCDLVRCAPICRHDGNHRSCSWSNTRGASICRKLTGGRPGARSGSLGALRPNSARSDRADDGARQCRKERCRLRSRFG